MHLNNLPTPRRSVPWVRCKSAVSGVLCVSSGELISGSDPPADVSFPGSQKDLVSNQEPTHILVEDAVSGAEIAPFFLTLAVAGLPLCLLQEDGMVCSWLAFLWYLLNPLFCEWARLSSRLELFTGKFFFFLSLDVPQFGFLSDLSSLRLSSGLSSSVMPPCLAPAHWWWR